MPFNYGLIVVIEEISEDVSFPKQGNLIRLLIASAMEIKLVRKILTSHLDDHTEDENQKSETHLNHYSFIFVKFLIFSTLSSFYPSKLRRNIRRRIQTSSYSTETGKQKQNLEHLVA